MQLEQSVRCALIRIYFLVCMKHELWICFVQVPLGVILKNEQKHDEMIEILDHLHQYVPTVTTTKNVDAPGLSPVCIPSDSFHHIAFGR